MCSDTADSRSNAIDKKPSLRADNPTRSCSTSLPLPSVPPPPTQSPVPPQKKGADGRNSLMPSCSAAIDWHFTVMIEHGLLNAYGPYVCTRVRLHVCGRTCAHTCAHTMLPPPCGGHRCCCSRGHWTWTARFQ